ncbi:LysR family transcriptional regulator substrate-binding protein [Nonomuraea sp. NPDC049480]|uniref:LysR family transcriptional regulator substrate-binding protein n=1 Tax=Nonomuraea sp. NPDC049480 TaxID=3364353 RepID=UPI0037B3C7C9
MDAGGRRLPAQAGMALRRLGWTATAPAGVTVNDRIARMALCLLDSMMQGRRVLDTVFEAIGAPVRPRIETDSISSLFAHVRTGRWAGIVPHAWLHVFGVPAGMRAVPLVEPVRTQRIGLVACRREPEPVMTQALLAVARDAGMAATLERLPS